MALQTYTYDGPERFHSLVGQVMASLGYVGGREIRDVGAAVTVRDDGGHLLLRQVGAPECDRLAHSGMFPCFLGGNASRLERSSRSARITWARVSCG